ncbi:unnamed protein product, partial [Rotaria sordida]
MFKSRWTIQQHYDAFTSGTISFTIKTNKQLGL